MNEEDMILKNLRLIYIQLKSLGLYGQCEDYYDVGVIGLIKGVKTFNPDLGYALSTYLSRCIRTELLSELRRENNNKNKANNNTISLDTVVYDNGDKSILLSDTIGCNIDIEYQVIKDEQIRLLNEAFKNLTDKEQLVLNHLFELNGHKKLTQCEIGELLSVNQATIHRIKSRAVKKLKLYIGESLFL